MIEEPLSSFLGELISLLKLLSFWCLGDFPYAWGDTGDSLPILASSTKTSLGFRKVRLAFDYICSAKAAITFLLKFKAYRYIACRWRANPDDDFFISK